MKHRTFTVAEYAENENLLYSHSYGDETKNVNCVYCVKMILDSGGAEIYIHYIYSNIK